MKRLLLSIFFIIIFIQINAQCTVNASNFGNNTSNQSYNVSGDVTVTLNTNNTITLNLGSNFSTANGPDVRAFLVNSEGKSVSELKSLNPSNLDNIPLGLVSCIGCNPVISANGAKTFTVEIPSGKDITKFDTIFFYCQQFTAFWDVGSFTPFSASNCAVLDINDFTFDKISIYPNPAKDKIHFSNIDVVSAEIRIFNVLGKQIYHQLKTKENTIDISTFKKGVYLIKIDVDGKSKTQKLVIQ